MDFSFHLFPGTSWCSSENTPDKHSQRSWYPLTLFSDPPRHLLFRLFFSLSGRIPSLVFHQSLTFFRQVESTVFPRVRTVLLAFTFGYCYGSTSLLTFPDYSASWLFFWISEAFILNIVIHLSDLLTLYAYMLLCQFNPKSSSLQWAWCRVSVNISYCIEQMSKQVYCSST